MYRYGKNILGISFIILLFLVSCSPESRYKVLTFLFDGVPERTFADETVKADSVINKDTVITAQNTVKKTPSTYFHPPYAERDCKGCHNDNMGQTLIKQPDLCYTCHENFEDNYLVMHGPAAGGYCTECHNPHKASIPKLLTEKGENLCLKCHDPEIKETDIHAIAETSDCVTCHNPHGEENKYLLVKGSCYNCHENFNEKYKFLHGPAGGGFCNSCHDTHESQADYKLLLTGQSLCYKCHKKEDVLKNENHEGLGDVACTECHNPHGGEDRYLFN